MSGSSPGRRQTEAEISTERLGPLPGRRCFRIPAIPGRGCSRTPVTSHPCSGVKSLASEVLGEPESIIDGGVDIPRRHRVPDTEELVATLGVAGDGLGPPRDEGAIIHLPAVEGTFLQGEIEIVEWKGAVFDHHLIHQAKLFKLLGIVTADAGTQPIALTFDSQEPPSDGDAHAVALEAFGVGGV